MRKEFNVRVSIAHNGMTTHRTYTRGSMSISRQAFCEWALGNLISLVMTGHTNSLELGNGINGVRVNLTNESFDAYSVEVIDDANTEDEIDNRFRESVGY